MILGTAASLPVVACVATPDRQGHAVECPYCGEVHLHGGHGPTSPAGAANGGRLSHCRLRSDRENDGYYVIFEVPGRVGRTVSDDRMDFLWTVAFELDRMPDLDDLLDEFIGYYEQIWDGLHRHGHKYDGFNYPPFQRGDVHWGYAYRGQGPVQAGTPPFPKGEYDKSREAKNARRFRRFITAKAKAGNQLAADIAADEWFPAHVLDYDTWATWLGVHMLSEIWEEALEDLWDEFNGGTVVEQRIQINPYVHMNVTTRRGYTVLLVWRVNLYDRLTGGLRPKSMPDAEADLTPEIVEALQAFWPANYEMYRRLGHRRSWSPHISGMFYDLHVPSHFQEAAIKVMTAVEVHGDTQPLRDLLAAVTAYQLAEQSTPAERTAIYKWFDADKVAIYFGITKDMHSRQTRHARYGAWGAFSDSCQVEWAGSRDDALRLERELIERDRPIFNRQHNNTPEARQRVVEYLTAHGRPDLLATTSPSVATRDRGSSRSRDFPDLAKHASDPAALEEYIWVQAAKSSGA